MNNPYFKPSVEEMLFHVSRTVNKANDRILTDLEDILGAVNESTKTAGDALSALLEKQEDDAEEYFLLDLIRSTDNYTPGFYEDYYEVYSKPYSIGYPDVQLSESLSDKEADAVLSIYRSLNAILHASGHPVIKIHDPYFCGDQDPVDKKWMLWKIVDLLDAIEESYNATMPWSKLTHELTNRRIQLEEEFVENALYKRVEEALKDVQDNYPYLGHDEIFFNWTDALVRAMKHFPDTAYLDPIDEAINLLNSYIRWCEERKLKGPVWWR